MGEVSTAPETELEDDTEIEEETPVIVSDSDPVPDPLPDDENIVEEEPEQGDVSKEEEPEQGDVPDGETGEENETTAPGTEQTTMSTEPKAVTPSAEAVISFDSKNGDEAETAKLNYLSGCVDANNKLATGKDLKFRIALNDGRKLKKVEAFIGGSQTATDLTNASANEDTIYTLLWSAIKETKTVEDKPVDVGRPVKIVVTTEAETYDITFLGTNAKFYKVVPVDSADAAKGNMKGDEVIEAVKGAAYDTAVTYIVEAENGYKLKDVKVGETPVTVSKTDLKATAGAAATTKYDTISIKPSVYKKAWEANTFAVTATADAKAELTAGFAENTNVTLSNGTATEEDAIRYTDSNFGAAIKEGSLKETSFLSFGVKAKTNYKVTGVTAVVKTATDTNGTAIPAADITAGTETDDGVTPYKISLKSLKDFTENTMVTITVATAWADDYATANVHTVTFAGDLKKANVTTGDGSEETELPEDNVVEVTTSETNSTLQINVTPNAGYALPKRGGNDDATKDDLVISVEKQVRYENATTAGTYDPAVKQTELLKVAEDKTTLTLVGEDKNYEGGDAQNAQDRSYTVVSATVTINTIPADNDAEKQLYVDNQLKLKGAKYSVQYAEAGKDPVDAILDETVINNNADDTWYIPEEAATVIVAVTGVEADPKVTLDDGVDPLDKEAGEGYTYVIPAKNLKTAAGNGSTLTIAAADPAEKKYADVKVKINTKEATLASYEVDEDTQEESLNSDGADYATLTNQAVIGKSLSLTFEKVAGATLKSVSYTMGEGEATKVDADIFGRATIKIEEVTGEVTVDVVSESAYVVKLYKANGTTELEKDGNEYKADYKEEDIQIKLYRTDNQKDDVEFYDVVVEEGTATAETAAEIDTAAGAGQYKSAKIAKIADNEHGKLLTIKVYKKGQAEPFVAKLRTNADSKSVKVTRVVNGKATQVKKDESVAVATDAAITFTVESVGASVSDLGVKLFKEGKALAAAEQAWFADAGVVAMNENGTFTIKTTPAKSAEKRGEVEVRIYNKNAEVKTGETEKALDGAGSFKLNVGGYMVKNDVKSITAVPGVANNTTVKLNLNTTFANKKNLPAKPEKGDLYYKVVLDTIGGDAAKVNAIADVSVTTKLTRYYKLEESKYADPAMTVAIDLIEDNRAVKTDIDAVLTTTVKEVSLVQSVSEKDLAQAPTVSDADDYVLGWSAVMKDKDKTLSTKKPLYETKLTVKAVNGAAVVTGQTDVKVATPVFGSNTGYDSLQVQFVDTKTGVALSNPKSAKDDPTVLQSNAYYNSYGSQAAVLKAWVDATDNSIHVWAKDKAVASNSLYKTLGVKVIAAYPHPGGDRGDGYAATAIVKLNVKQGIFAIAADESKGTLPEAIWQNGKKNASLKITPLLNHGSKDIKPAKTTLDWKIDHDSQSENIQKNLDRTVKGKAAPTISVKNGTLTVTKDYAFSADGTQDSVTVTATAADFAGRETPLTKQFIFTIKHNADAVTADSLVIVDGSGNVKDAKALKATDFDTQLYVAALRDGVKKGQTSYTVATDFMPVTFKSSAKANLEVGLPDSNNRAALTFKKPGTKLKINVNTVDGGNAKAVLEVNIAAYGKGNLGLSFAGADGSHYDADTTETIKYKGGSNQMYTLTLQHKKANDQWISDGKYKNVKVTVKGGKFIANKYWAKYSNIANMGTAVVVTSADGKATVTVTDTANKNEVVAEYKIENESATDASNKAPSIKLYQAWEYDARGNYVAGKKVTADTDKIVYQVTNKTKNNYVGEYVKVTPDYTAANNMAEHLADGYGTITIAKIDENGRFEMYPGYLSYSGSYKMVATVGSMEYGVFCPKAKDVKLNFSIPKEKKVNTNLTVKGSYTLDAKSSSKINIDVKTDNRLSYVISDAKDVIIDTKTQTAEKHTNNFTKYFEVKPVKDSYGYLDHYTIGLKSDLNASDIAYISGANKEDKEAVKAAKADCVGYITVTNCDSVSPSGGSYTADGTKYNTKDIKVTISFKENKYTVTPASIFAPKNEEVPVRVWVLSGKNWVPVAAADLDPDDGKTFAKTATEKDGDIIITSNTSVEAKKHDVKLKVIPLDSGYVKSYNVVNGEVKDVVFVNKPGTETPYTKAEVLATAAGVSVTAKIDVKAIDAKKVISIKNLNVPLSADNYVTGQELARTGKMGDYVAYVPYSFVAGNTRIADGADAVALEKDSKSNKTLNEIAGQTDGRNLITVEKTVVKNTNYLKISINKACLENQYELTEKDKAKKASAEEKAKIVTTYGKKLTIPVVLTYTNNGATKETVKFNVTMPKKPLSFEEVYKILDGQTKLGTGKNARDIKAEIESLTTPQAERSNEILNGLLVKVWNKVDANIPKDADIALTPDWSELDGEEVDAVKKANLNTGETEAEDADTTNPAAYDDIMNLNKAKVNMTITSTLTGGATQKLTYDFSDKLGVKHTKTSANATVAETVKTAIQTYLNTLKGASYNSDQYLTITNELTEEKLMETVKGLEGVKEYLASSRDSIDIWVETCTGLGEATERADANVKIKICVNDEDTAAELTGKIKKLNNIGDVTAKLNALFTADYVKEIVDDCSGIKDEMKKVILAEAKKAVANDKIEVTYAQREKAAQPAAAEAAKEMEDDFTYNAATESAGSIIFKLQIKSEKGRIVTWAPESEITLDANSAAKYCDTAEKAVAAIVKAKITSGTQNTAEFDLLKTALDDLEANTEDAVKTAVKTHLGAAALATVVTGWTVKDNDITVTYNTPAEPDTKGADNAVVKHPGKVTIIASIYLKGNPEVKDTLTVTDAAVVDWKGEFQTAEQLKKAIEDWAEIIEVNADSDLPADKAGAEAKIGTQFADASFVTGTGLTAAINTDEGVTAGAFEKNDTAKTATYKNVPIKITVAGVTEPIKFTATFNWSVKAAD